MYFYILVILPTVASMSKKIIFSHECPRRLIPRTNVQEDRLILARMSKRINSSLSKKINISHVSHFACRPVPVLKLVPSAALLSHENASVLHARQAATEKRAVERENVVYILVFSGPACCAFSRSLLLGARRT